MALASAILTRLSTIRPIQSSSIALTRRCVPFKCRSEYVARRQYWLCNSPLSGSAPSFSNKASFPTEWLASSIPNAAKSAATRMIVPVPGFMVLTRQSPTDPRSSGAAPVGASGSPAYQSLKSPTCSCVSITFPHPKCE